MATKKAAPKPEVTAHAEEKRCPSCGYCPTCGRSNNWFQRVPYYPVPYYPYRIYPGYPWYTVTVGTSGNTIGNTISAGGSSATGQVYNTASGQYPLQSVS